jgi:hypothetical protein
MPSTAMSTSPLRRDGTVKENDVGNLMGADCPAAGKSSAVWAVGFET